MFRDEPLRAHLIRLYVILTAALLPFVIEPEIDLWASELFFDGTEFRLEHWRGIQAVREALWAMVIALFVFAVAMVPWTAARRIATRPVRVPLRVWLMISTLYLLGPGLLTNLILKSHWGRMRPEYVFENGAPFTGPLAIQGGCDHNCSFVSGEGAGATAFALALLWLSPALGPRGCRALQVFALSFAIAGLGLRVVMGRHFLSDALFAALFTWTIWSLLSRALPSDWRCSVRLGKPDG